MCADRRADAVGGIVSADVPSDVERGGKHGADQKKFNHVRVVIVSGRFETKRISLLRRNKLPQAREGDDTPAPDSYLVQVNLISSGKMREGYLAIPRLFRIPLRSSAHMQE